MDMLLLDKEQKPQIIFRGTPEEIFALQQLIMKTAKNGGELSDLEMVFLNTLMDRGSQHD